MTAIIKVENITKEFPGKLALDELSLEIAQGSIHGLMGVNGAGKSTSIKIMAGLLAPDSGQLLLKGQNLYEELKQGRKGLLRHIGILPENLPLYFNMEVREFLSFIQKIRLFKSDRERLDWAIEKSGLIEVQNKRISTLSKGYKQRVGIAQAVVHRPDIIILDEPMVGLDPHAIFEIREFILGLSVEHTILLSGHQLHELSLLCSDVTIIDKGKNILSSPVKMLERYRHEKERWSFLVSTWNEKIEHLLKEKYGPEIVSIETVGTNQFRVVLGLEEQIVASDIGQDLLETNCSVFEMKKEAFDLERIFKEVTRRSE